MSLPAITEEDILTLLEEYPEGFSLEGLAARVSDKVFPLGIMALLVVLGQVIIVNHTERGAIWAGYRYRLSATEWLRRQR